MSEKEDHLKAHFFGGTLDGKTRNISREQEFFRVDTPVNLPLAFIPIDPLEMVETILEINQRARVPRDNTADFRLVARHLQGGPNLLILPVERRDDE